MIDTIYVETEIAEHPRTLEIRARFSRADWIEIERYGEIFNRRNQDFRLQKRNPALILARKHGRLVLPAPDGYGIGGEHNFYFSHMLNCLYDCRYCFLQGMFQSANYLLFVNYEDFEADLRETAARTPDESVHFFSGYDCDSLALESVTGFAKAFIPWIERIPNAWLELRTKSVNTRGLEDREPMPRCIVAFSMTPEPISLALEHGVPPLARRLEAAARLQRRGWPIGLRFDPLVYTPDFKKQYRDLFDQVFAQLDPSAIHSVSYGPFRLPREMFKTMTRLYPEEPLFAGPLHERNAMISYQAELEKMMIDFCDEALASRVPAHALYPCRF